ncbi:succinate--CoA ligase subunit alpha [Actinocrispum wychmicini]|uniref:Succinyl-CoA synthetase alpha subunit n=1 Tax=Actinocrispum wychmicini TaxID=1213861 RepID=A0A4R2JLR9_9PSEU|nr:succinate--CoA ligase subunit alpha [Actinocrispum wychmicini]TCO55135.1 succinyl-CoA synthetase alpha subunit [Actinocrispum wychmicini]
MAIFINADSRVIVQGMTGSEGRGHTARMLAAGTNVTGGVTPGKGGQTVHIGGTDLPVYDSVAKAMADTGADTTVIFVPPKFARAAAIDAEIGLAVVITEGIPVHDSVYFWAHAVAAGNRTRRDIGFSTAAGIGGDSVIGTTHIDAFKAFQDDPDTELIVLIGEIGGDAEERAAAFVKDNVTKPVVGYVAGFTAPEGKTMGHTGAIVAGSAGTAVAKKDALEAAGVWVSRTPSETATLARQLL